MHAVQIEAAQKLHYSEVRKRLGVGIAKPAPKKVRDIIWIEASDTGSNASEVAQYRLSHLEKRMAEMSKGVSTLSWRVGSIIDRMDGGAMPSGFLAKGEDDCKPLYRIAAERWKDVLEEVAEKHGLTVTEMLARRRAKPIVHARQEACWRLVKELGYSYPQVARRCNYYDHTTALHAVRKHQERLDAQALEAVNAR